ncbi:phosphate ABC transporter substrate-binding protein PstS [Aeromicrobium sp. Leaf350]|uniref:phosphate ABC transporter substrate-binding protein PstS n=1 Tax=Aeromicrobium sp. Leaf350 TaxID=2876565 RepID=UPI001E339314|nr:phosphate ABC transporter substrate-binding protein PstS [Aeromicrobium sp. Leaf350]
MKRNTLRASVSAAAVLSLALVLGACGAGNEESSGSGDLSGTLNGAGASSQQATVAAWKSSFQTENPDATVNYDPVGSGGGREQFIAGGVDFAGSDAPLDDEELAAAKERCGGEIVEVPVYVSPIAVVFNLEGVDSLNLSAQTIGAIFEGTITTWNDPAIAADNPDADLPSDPIVTVHRSDDSGTTKNFTAYLEETSGGSWTAGEVETWPTPEGESAQGTAGMIDRVGATANSIGYADASQAGDLSTAAVKVGEDFVEYSPEAAAAILEKSAPIEGRGETDLALEIDRATEEAGVYPVVLVSYAIACQTYEDEAKAELVKGWLAYLVSEEGQAKAAEDAGAAPIGGDIATQAQDAVETISAG